MHCLTPKIAKRGEDPPKAILEAGGSAPDLEYRKKPEKQRSR